MCWAEESKLCGTGNSLFVLCLHKIWVDGSCCSETGALVRYSCTNINTMG